MKIIAILLSIAISCAVAGTENLAFEVIPNTSPFPLPYELPKVAEGSAGKFDWKKYVDESKSEVDRAFRIWLACSEYGQTFADARMRAYLNFRKNLEALRDSLHLQDLPE